MNVNDYLEFRANPGMVDVTQAASTHIKILEVIH